MTDEEKKQQKELWKQDQIRERQEEWQKIKSLGFGARLQYFWDYYKIVLVIVIIAVFVIYLIVNMIQGARTQTLLYACFLNSDELDPDTEGLRDAYIRERGELGKMQEITFDSSIYVDPYASGTSQRDVATMIKITSFVGAGAVDVFLTPSHVTEFEQKNDLFMPLENVLTPEEIKTLGEAGCLYYADEPEPDTEDTGWETGTQEAGSAEGSVQEAGTAEGSVQEGGTQEARSAEGSVQEAGTAAGSSEKSEARTAQTIPGGGMQSSDGEYALNTDPEKGKHIYAVRVDQAGVLGRFPIYADRQVWFSIIGNTSRTEEALGFLHFLLGEKAPAIPSMIDQKHRETGAS